MAMKIEGADHANIAVHISHNYITLHPWGVVPFWRESTFHPESLTGGVP